MFYRICQFTFGEFKGLHVQWYKMLTSPFPNVVGSVKADLSSQQYVGKDEDLLGSFRPCPEGLPYHVHQVLGRCTDDVIKPHDGHVQYVICLQKLKMILGLFNLLIVF